MQVTSIYAPKTLAATHATKDALVNSLNVEQVRQNCEAIRKIVEVSLEFIQHVCECVQQTTSSTPLYFSKKNEAFSTNKRIGSFYIIPTAAGKEVYISGDKKLHHRKTSSPIEESLTIKAAVRLHFLDNNQFEKAEPVVKLSTPFDKSSGPVWHDRVSRQAATMQALAGTPYFPTNYAFVTRAGAHGQRLEILQERAAGDLFALHEKQPNHLYKTKLLLAERLIRAVDQMHSSQVIHKDLKLENILVYLDGAKQPHLKISDFGTACFAHDTSTVQEVSGSFFWAAPELLNRFHNDLTFPLSKAVDIWGLGLILSILNKKDPEILLLLMDLDALRDKTVLCKKALRHYDALLNINAKFKEIDPKTDEVAIQIRLQKELFQTRFDDLEVTIAEKWNSWKELLKRMPPRPQTIQTLDDLIVAMLQPDPTKRITSAEAVTEIEKLLPTQ